MTKLVLEFCGMWRPLLSAKITGACNVGQGQCVCLKSMINLITMQCLILVAITPAEKHTLM